SPILGARASADGTRIVFTKTQRSLVDSTNDNATQLWVADADGSNARAVLSVGKNTLESNEWSPDGHTIVVSMADENYENIGLYTLNVDDTNPTLSPLLSLTNLSPTYAQFSPNNSKIAYQYSELSGDPQSTTYGICIL